MAARSDRKHVSVVATPDVMLATLAGLYDVFRCFGALGWFDESLTRNPPFEVSVVSTDRGKLRTASGLELAEQRMLDEVRHTDIVVVPSVMVPDGRWVRGRHPDLVQWLLQVHQEGAELCSACSGTLLLAETGLLDGRAATMHWAYAETFRRNFPAVKLDLDKALIVAGDRDQLVMSGAATSWNDLALFLIARHVSPAAAQAVAKFFAFQWHREGMAPYTVFMPGTDHGDALIADVQAWIAENYFMESPVRGMVAHAGLAERSFKRRFKHATGLAPIQYVQALRLDESKRLLESTRKPVDDVAWAVGYEDPAYFRRLFKNRVGLTPGTYRKKFQVPEFARAGHPGPSEVSA